MSDLSNVYESTIAWAEQRKIPLHSEIKMDSTNDFAKSEAFRDSQSFKLFVTAHQLKGRGRGTNSWQDTGSGDCLLSSWSFQLNGAPQPITGPLVGLALFHAVQKVWPEKNWSIKAPNDLYLDDKKIAGILTESVSSGENTRLIVGVGMNVLNHPRGIENSTHFDSGVGAAEWFMFLDELYAQLKSTALTCLNHQMSSTHCQELLNALNANPNKTFVATTVTPTGDIVFSGGRLRWSDI